MVERLVQKSGEGSELQCTAGIIISLYRELRVEILKVAKVSKTTCNVCRYFLTFHE